MQKERKIRFLGLCVLSGILLGGCSPSVWYNPVSGASATGQVDLSQKSPSFREGYEAGCQTAGGDYNKSSERFNSDSEYHEGWFAGRSACQQK